MLTNSELSDIHDYLDKHDWEDLYEFRWKDGKMEQRVVKICKLCGKSHPECTKGNGVYVFDYNEAKKLMYGCQS
jgi:hypothetical protein